MPNTAKTPTRYTHKTLTYLAPDAGQSPDFNRLPFVYCSKAGVVKSYWALPATGDYLGGYEAGTLMAKAYLRHMATSGDYYDSQKLILILAALDGRLEAAHNHHQSHTVPVCDLPDEVTALRGQRLGFINELGYALLAGSRVLATHFDLPSVAELTSKANEALKQTKAEAIAHLERLHSDKPTGGDQ